MGPRVAPPVVLEALAANWQMVFVFSLIVVVLGLFVTEALPMEVTALLSLVVLAFAGILSPLEAFAGFSNPATLAVLMMFVLSAGVLQSGLIDWLGDRMGTLMGKRVSRQVLVVGILVGPLSAFINNTPAVAVFIPLVIHLANKSGNSPSRLLIPLSFAAMLGGTLTLIGTSTNLLASEIRRDAGLDAFGMFEFTKAGLIVFSVGLGYLVLIGHRLIPERIESRPIDDRFRLREFLFEVEVPPESELIGESVGEADLAEKYDAEVVQVLRGSSWKDPDDEAITYAKGDVLLVRAGRADLQRMADTGIVSLRPADRKPRQGGEEFEHDDLRFAEILVAPNSRLAGKRMDQMRLWKEHRVRPVALLTRGQRRIERLRLQTLRQGDVVLVQVHQRDLANLSGGSDFFVLGGPDTPLRRPHKIPHVLAILGLVVAVAALGWFPIHLTATAGAIAMVVVGALRLDDMYDSISWRIIFLLAGIIPLGMALQATGGAAFLAGLVALSANYLPPIAVLALVYLLTTVLTEILSNNAAVVLVVPVAIELAATLGLNPTTFVLACMFAASTSFLTPVGYQTNLMVMSPGGYRYTDYLRVGAPLNLIMVVVTPLVLNAFWPVTAAG